MCCCHRQDGEKCVHELARIIREKKKGLFIDPVFPPNNTSLFANPEQAGANAGTKQSFRKDQDPFLAGVSGKDRTRPEQTNSILSIHSRTPDIRIRSQSQVSHPALPASLHLCILTYLDFFYVGVRCVSSRGSTPPPQLRATTPLDPPSP